jgi:hypothetical protein
MKDSVLFKFWSDWEDSIDKSTKIEQLALFDKFYMDGQLDDQKKHIYATMFNSYLEDLYEYMITKYKIDV